MDERENSVKPSEGVMRRKLSAYWPEWGSILNQLQVDIAHQITNLSPMRKSRGSLVFILAITLDVSHGRASVARKEDLAAGPALDRISP